MFGYQASDFIIQVLLVVVTLCTIRYLWGVRKNELDLHHLIFLQAVVMAVLFMLAFITEHIANDHMEKALRNNFIPGENYHYFDTQRFQIYDQLGDTSWYQQDETTPSLLGVYDLKTGSFTYYQKLKSYDILKK